MGDRALPRGTARRRPLLSPWHRSHSQLSSLTASSSESSPERQQNDALPTQRSQRHDIRTAISSVRPHNGTADPVSAALGNPSTQTARALPASSTSLSSASREIPYHEAGTPQLTSATTGSFADTPSSGKSNPIPGSLSMFFDSATKNQPQLAGTTEACDEGGANTTLQGPSGTVSNALTQAESSVHSQEAASWHKAHHHHDRGDMPSEVLKSKFFPGSSQTSAFGDEYFHLQRPKRPRQHPPPALAARSSSSPSKTASLFGRNRRSSASMSPRRIPSEGVLKSATGLALSSSAARPLSPASSSGSEHAGPSFTARTDAFGDAVATKDTASSSAMPSRAPRGCAIPKRRLNSSRKLGPHLAAPFRPVCNCAGEKGLACGWRLDGVDYCTDDFVYVSSGWKNEPHLMAKILDVHPTYIKHQAYVQVQWVYRYAELGDHAARQARRLVGDNVHLARSVFPSAVTDPIPVNRLRGKCRIAPLSTLLDIDSYLAVPDTFVFAYHYDDAENELFQPGDEEMIGRQIEVADVPTGTDEPSSLREELVLDGPACDAHNRFTALCRSAGSLAYLRHVDDDEERASQAVRHDQFLWNSLHVLHDNNYNLGASLKAIKTKAPCRSPLERWGPHRLKEFGNALRECRKQFSVMQRRFFPDMSVKELVEFYYLWKTTMYARKSAMREYSHTVTDNFDKVEREDAFSTIMNGVRKTEMCDHCHEYERKVDWLPRGTHHTQWLCVHCFKFFKKYGYLPDKGERGRL